MAFESEILVPEIQFIILLILSVIVAITVKYIKFPYTIALLIVGILVGLTGIEEIELSQELIFFIFLPALLFEGSIHIDIQRLKSNAPLIMLLAFAGLTIAILAVGFAINQFLGLPIIIAMLLGAMIMPTDPVSVLALFKKLGVSKRLTTIVEGESLFNDGTGVVLFHVLLAIALGEADFNLAATLVNFAYVVVGGLGIGIILGYFAYGILKNINDHLIEVMITAILAYGTFITAELLHTSGVMGVVAAGLFIGNRGTEFAMSPKTRISILTSWELAAFIINSVIFLLMGIKIPLISILDNITNVALVIAVTVIARILATYPLVGIYNLSSKNKINTKWQHVINWGGLHGSVPIALVLGLPDMPYKEELSVLVFGAVLFSLIFQGLTMEPLIKKLKIISMNPAEKEYEKIMTKKIANRSAQDTLEKLNARKEIPDVLYKNFKEAFEDEARYLKSIAAKKLEDEKMLFDKQKNTTQKKLLLSQKSSIFDSLRKGLVSEEVASELIEEIDSKIDELME